MEEISRQDIQRWDKESLVLNPVEGGKREKKASVSMSTAKGRLGLLLNEMGDQVKEH